MRRVLLSELLRKKRGSISLREMARACSLSAPSLLRIETGETTHPEDDTLTALSEAYGIPRETLALAAYGEYFEEILEPEPVSV